MKILIQSRGTMRFIGKKGEWTQCIDEALGFRSGLEGMSYCAKHKIDQACLFYRFKEDPSLDFRIILSDGPVSKEFGAALLSSYSDDQALRERSARRRCTRGRVMRCGKRIPAGEAGE